MGTIMDRVKNRFSSQCFQKVIDSLSNDQKGFLEKNGFKKFLGFWKFVVPMLFLEWVMGQVVVDLSEFKHRGKSFKFTRFMIQQILGIPSGEIPIILHTGASKTVNQSIQPNSLFMHGEKLSIRDAVQNLLAEHNEEAFMRLFMLIALSTIFCPSTQNFVNINYLPYLLDVSQIHTYDWCSHVINYIFSEVKKYQDFISSKDNGNIYVGSCLPLLAIAYLDFIDLSRDYANHHNICYYDLPRICNVTSNDFLFVANVDRNLSNPGRPSYGILEFRSLSSSPYYEASINDGCFEHDNSLNSNPVPAPQHESDDNFQVIPSIQVLIDKHYNSLKTDVLAGIVGKGESVYSDFANHFGPIFLNRLSLLSTEIVSHINSIKPHTDSEENDIVRMDSGHSPLLCQSLNDLVIEDTTSQKDYNADDIQNQSDTIQHLLDNLIDHANASRLSSSQFDQPCDKLCSISQAVQIDDINCPSTPVSSNQIGDDFQEEIEPSELHCTFRVNPKRKCRMGSSTIDKKKKGRREQLSP